MCDVLSINFVSFAKTAHYCESLFTQLVDLFEQTEQSESLNLDLLHLDPLHLVSLKDS